ncbi:MAG: MliC family protein [Bauldia sp.]|nr:MliC family protein [Bauldia sp.]
MIRRRRYGWSHVGGAAALGLTFALLAGGTASAAEEPTGKAVFACKDDKSIEATFYAEKVDLKLSDGRTMTLPQTMSGSGIRYANADETFVFWSKGNTAFVTEGADEKDTFSDCVAPD